MPLLSSFFGIKIRIFTETNGQHHAPHIHASYGDDAAVFDLYGNVIKGELPYKQRHMVQGWMAIHEEEIFNAWKAAVAGAPVFQIEPLK